MTNIKELFDNLTEKNHRIVVPKIQRDYAYGRDKETKTKDSFLQEAFNALTSNTGDKLFRLNYVYGVPTTEGGNTEIVLIDGQQRLTTLFLIYLYLAINSGQSVEFADKFSYETRMTSKKFFFYLTEQTHTRILEFDPNNSLSEKLHNDKGFFKCWENDPTVHSIIVVLDSIEAKVKQAQVPNRNVFESYLNNLQNIQFDFILLEGFKREEALYTTMNGRGKQLTEFEKLKPDIYDVFKGTPNFKDILNNIWTPAFWEYAYAVTPNINGVAPEEKDRFAYTVDKHDQYLFNYFRYIVSMLYFENCATDKKTPPMDDLVKWLKNQNSQEINDRIIFAMKLFCDELRNSSSIFSMDLATENKDQGNQKTNLFHSGISLDFLKDCCDNNDPDEFPHLERILLWAYITYRYNKEKGSLNSKSLRGYYVLMRDLYFASLDRQTPSIKKLSPELDNVLEGVKAFKAIINNEGNVNARYQNAEATFNANNIEKYRILNNVFTMGCSNNIAAIIQQNGVSDKQAEQFADNLDYLYDNSGIVSAKALNRHFICYKASTSKLYIPGCANFFKSLFSRKYWLEPDTNGNDWYKSFLNELYTKKLSDHGITYSPNEWMYYFEKYPNSFAENNPYCCYEFECENATPKWFDMRGVYGERATNKQTISPFYLQVYQLLHPTVTKDLIPNAVAFVENHTLSLVQDGSDFIWRYDGSSHTCNGTQDIIEEFINWYNAGPTAEAPPVENASPDTSEVGSHETQPSEESSQEESGVQPLPEPVADEANGETNVEQDFWDNRSIEKWLQEIEYIGTRRCYPISLVRSQASQDEGYVIDDTKPRYLIIEGKRIKATSWKDLLIETATYLLIKYPEYKSKLTEFQKKGDVSHKSFSFDNPQQYDEKVAEGIWINCNNTSRQAYWFLQDLLAFFNIDLQDAKLVIYRPASAEPKVVKEYFKQITIDGFRYYLIHEGYEELWAQTTITFLDEALYGKLNIHKENYLFLFDDANTAQKEISGIQEEIQTSTFPKNTEDRKKQWLKYLDLLKSFYKKTSFLQDIANGVVPNQQ